MRLAIKTCTLDMPFPDMLDFCCTHHVSAVEIGTGNWSNAPHIDLEALVTSNSARIKWHDEIRRRGLSLCALNCRWPILVIGRLQRKPSSWLSIWA